MNWKKLKDEQLKNALNDFTVSSANCWDETNSNPVDDLKRASEILAKHESFYTKSMKWLFGSHLKDRKN